MRHLPRLVVIGLIWLSSSPAWAQLPTTDTFDRAEPRTDTLRVRGMRHAPGWVVKLSPLSLFDVEGLYRVDVERMLGGPFSVQGGLGYGSSFMQLFRTNNSRTDDREAWRAQVEGRVYVQRVREASRWQPNRLIIHKPLDRYLALEVFYKQVAGSFSGTLSRGCETGNCQFFERYTAQAFRYVLGTHLKYGQQSAIRLSGNNNRLLIDYYVGLGMRWRWFEQRGVPNRDDAQAAWPNTFGSDPTSSWGTQAGRFPSLALGVQVGYAF